MRTLPCCLVVVLAAVGAGACASGGGVPVPRPFPVPGEASTPGAAVPTPLIRTALALRGAPYRNGGADPSGFDCSGFIHYVFGRHGVELPRVVAEQYHAGRPVRRGDLRPGDLVFFTTVAPGASHVGLALGGDEFVHAPSTRGVVRVERLSSSYWSRRFIGARRLAHH